MGSNVNVFYSNWEKTGQTVQVDQWTADFRIEWKDNEGVEHDWEGVITFPNDLALVPPAWLKEELADLTLRAARKRLEID